MLKEFAYRFSELVTDKKLMAGVMGYEDGRLPEPFASYLDKAISDGPDFDDIRAAYRIIDEAPVSSTGDSIRSGGIVLSAGKTVCSEISGSSRFAVFVCTAGKKISERSVSFLKGEDPVLGYVYDILGSAIAEAACDKMKESLLSEVSERGETITNSYSPGYCNWSVSDQHSLFSFFGGSVCGVTLTRSALMHPVKSISGIIGIGKNVGFPGETEADFEETLSLVREVRFDQAFLYKYSERKDTPAAAMPDQVPQPVREERHQRLLQTLNAVARDNYRACVGRTMQILVEGPSKKNPARFTGRTQCNKIVVFDGSERHRGQLLDVRITRTGSFTLYGDPAVVGL